jgi:hypothetical protein
VVAVVESVVQLGLLRLTLVPYEGDEILCACISAQIGKTFHLVTLLSECMFDVFSPNVFQFSVVESNSNMYSPTTPA